MVKLEMIHKLQCLDASINGAENYRPGILRGVIPKNCNLAVSFAWSEATLALPMGELSAEQAD